MRGFWKRCCRGYLGRAEKASREGGDSGCFSFKTETLIGILQTYRGVFRLALESGRPALLPPMKNEVSADDKRFSVIFSRYPAD